MLKNERELQNTRQKLQRLETRYSAKESETGGDAELREATLVSLKRYINQFKEEIARFEAHCAPRNFETSKSDRSDD